MFGTKIRSWMEAHIARSRAKKKERGKAAAAAAAATVTAANAASTLQSQYQQQQQHLHEYNVEAKFFGARADFNETLPALPISPSSFKTRQDNHHHHHRQQQQQQQQQQQPQQPQQQQQHQQQQKQQQYGNNKNVGQGVGSAVNLSSPESAYSTGYSTDGTSPCATYAPEYYINVRPTTGRHCATVQPTNTRTNGPLDTTTQTRSSRVRALERSDECRNAGSRANEISLAKTDDRLENTGTYSVSATRSRFLESKEYEHHPWRKPAPPTISRPIATSPKIQNGHLMRKPYSTPVVTDCGATTSYPLQLFSPRRLPLVAATTTQVMPIKSPRQRSRVRTNPWQGVSRNGPQAMPGVPRPWSRQQPASNPNLDYCCRQESLSVGRSPVNRSDWRCSAQLRQQQQQQQQQQHQLQLRNKGRRSSSASSCNSSGRSRSRSCSRSCSVSSSNSSSSHGLSNPSSPSSDDITLNEVMGKFDDNYLYEKETDIVSDHSGSNANCLGGITDNNSSSVNFSSDASASSLDLHHEAGGGDSSRSNSRHQRGLSGRRQRRRRHRRSVEPREEEDREHREEVELLQEVLNRRLKKNNSEASAQTNRALLERLLMKNSSIGFESRRAWSTNQALMRPAAASRSVGGTPICLRRKTTRTGHMLSPPSRLIFDRNQQVYPAESTSSLKNMSASELALIEADKEADLKYAQLIMEAERMLVSAQQQLQREELQSAGNSRRGSSASVTADNSPSRFPRRPYQQQQQSQTCKGSAPNKRVELIKNAELTIELALSKSRNSQPELSSGSIKDLLDHSSPKRLLQQQQKKTIEPVINQIISTTEPVANNLTVFQSIDVNPTLMKGCSSGAATQSDELSSTSEQHYACPQSEPVKRKVYEGQDGGRLLQQRQAAPWLRSSDSDCANDQQLQPQLQSASAASSYSQLRKQMLIETLQGLKQSLEDQSAALKMSCLRPL